MHTCCRFQVAILGSGYACVEFLMDRLIFRNLTDATFRWIGDIERMISGRLLLAIAALHNERVRFATFHVQFGDEFIVQIPRNAPRRYASDWRVAALTACRSNASCYLFHADQFSRFPWRWCVRIANTIQRRSTIVVGLLVIINVNLATLDSIFMNSVPYSWGEVDFHVLVIDAHSVVRMCVSFALGIQWADGGNYG